jgi:Protein of unknown function (DUF1573)
MKIAALSISLTCVVLSSLSLGQIPKYKLSSWFMPSSVREAYVIHDFNDNGVVAGTWMRSDAGGIEEARGIFVWKNGVMRKITPAQGGVKSTLSPAEGTSTGYVRISNVRNDGTFLLAAPARQTVPASAFEVVHDIHRVIRYTIQADLQTFPQPVVSATALGGFIFKDFNTQPGWNREFSGGVTDIAENGTVLGYCSDWPYFYPPTLLWRAKGGYSGRYFDGDAAGALGGPSAMDRNGYIIGSAYDATPPGKNILYDAPLSSLTTRSADITLFPTLAGFVDSVDGNPNNLIYAIPTVHGPYRAMPSRVPGSTAVWSNRFADVSIAQNFRLETPSSYMPSRKSLSRNGHMLGRIDQYPHAALAMRKANGNYMSVLIQELEPNGMRSKPPFSYTTMGYDDLYLTNPVAINSNLDLLCEYLDERGQGFFVLKALPPAPEITVTQGSGAAMDLKSDKSKRDFGTVTVGETSRTMVFTIKNDGNAPLSKLNVSLKDLQSADFLFIKKPAESIAPGQTALFKVSYKPLKVRASKTVLHITSNDSDENPFRVILSGEGVK